MPKFVERRTWKEASQLAVAKYTHFPFQFISYPGQDPIKVAGIYAGLWEMYARPYTKCGPFLLGILLGTATTSMKPRLGRDMSRLIASAFFVLCICVIYAILPQYWYGDYFKLYNLCYTAAFRTVFSFGICGVILAFISRLERWACTLLIVDKNTALKMASISRPQRTFF